eukprot:TRINITY_DN2_c0_g1_i1.p1 TRINITY_DN2_c0_g1~~TRINITY_DN2_c0_g1_i1.p1  ORF type:complete len:331 (-),score=78.16 TRINITY_DN2_c0_g1_i1:131-1123(-)
MASVLGKYNGSWHHTMLRIKDPKLSVPFYESNFGFKLLTRLDFPQWKFSLYFLAILPEGEEGPKDPLSAEAQNYLWTFKGTVVELTHNYGTESDPEFKHNNGNVEPNRGFGHIAVNTEDVYDACAKLESNGVKFQKKPDEGRMKGLAFALDPDGYWIEIVRRGENSGIKNYYNLSQTMIRIKDPAKSVPFYRDVLGMTLVRETHFPDAKFSLYFFASLPQGTTVPDPTSQEGYDYVKKLWNPVLELTHNHGTESDTNFKYHSGNEEPKGFGHLAFLVDNINDAAADLEANKVQFKKKPTDGSMKGIAFIYDPDGYWIELVQRGLVIEQPK